MLHSKYVYTKEREREIEKNRKKNKQINDCCYLVLTTLQLLLNKKEVNINFLWPLFSLMIDHKTIAQKKMPRGHITIYI